MALRRHGNDIKAFPTPNRSEVIYHPNTYRDYHTYSYDVAEHRYSTRRSEYSHQYREAYRGVELADKTLDYAGDLGWSLDYATAWCYKFLIGNQTEVADVIDNMRELRSVKWKTPYLIFDSLDKAMFSGKLKDMVYLRWKAQAGIVCGRTSTPSVVRESARICIELNSLLFKDGYGDVDDLLDALLHQMIHAFFLVCCGAQPEEAKQDGRLTDGLHFGVLLHTIRDISKQCYSGRLRLIFYAATRRQIRYSSNSNQKQYSNAYGYDIAAPSRRNRNQTWISINPAGSLVPAAPADGQSHCSHDNSSISPSQVKNWQVEHYARAIDLNMEQRGDLIYDIGIDGVFVPTDRLKGPPSSTYVELIWDCKRIMVPREKALMFASIKKPLERMGQYELRVPDCSSAVLRCVYDFLQYRSYWKDHRDTVMDLASHHPQGPPVLLIDTVLPMGSIHRMAEHIKVFKIAEDMKFEELQLYALQRLNDMPTTSDDPIEALKELYNEGKGHGRPIHASLHTWARDFLKRREDGYASYYGSSPDERSDSCYGMSNYHKIMYRCGDRFQELYQRNIAFQDDCKIVSAELSFGIGMNLLHHNDLTFGCFPMRPMMPRPHSYPSVLPLNGPWSALLSATATPLASRSVDDLDLMSTWHAPRLLEAPVPSYYDPSGAWIARQNGMLR